MNGKTARRIRKAATRLYPKTIERRRRYRRRLFNLFGQEMEVIQETIVLQGGRALYQRAKRLLNRVPRPQRELALQLMDDPVRARERLLG